MSTLKAGWHFCRCRLELQSATYLWRGRWDESSPTHACLSVRLSHRVMMIARTRPQGCLSWIPRVVNLSCVFISPNSPESLTAAVRVYAKYTCSKYLLPHAVDCGGFCFSARSVCGFLFVIWNISGTVERNCAKFTRKTCLVPRSEKFVGQDQRSKVKGYQEWKRHFRPFRRPACGLCLVKRL